MPSQTQAPLLTFGNMFTFVLMLSLFESGRAMILALSVLLRKQLCNEMLSKVETNILTNKVQLLEFCKAVTMNSSYTNTEEYEKPILG